MLLISFASARVLPLLNSPFDSHEAAVHVMGYGSRARSVAVTEPGTNYNHAFSICIGFKSKVGSRVERFAVSALPTDSTKQVGLRGCLQMCFFQIHIGFCRVGDDECFVLWPVSVIRLYRLDSLPGAVTIKDKRSRSVVVTIEVGRYVQAFHS